MMATFAAPSREQVQEAIRRIPSLALRRAFYEGLRNPLWVRALAREGAFRDPPEPEVGEDGLVRDLYWPEIDYLVRSAEHAPADVVDVLLTLKASRNAWVRRGAFAVAAVVPPDEATRLAPLFKGWLMSGFGWRTDPQTLIDTAVNLLRSARPDLGHWFANVIFMPTGRKSRRRRLQLGEYWYEQGIARVAPALGPDGLDLIVRWLLAHERAIGHLTKHSDLTSFGRPSIAAPGERYDNAENALIDAVRDVAVQAMESHPIATKDKLLDEPTLLTRKIAMFAASEVLKRPAVSDAGRQELLNVAYGLLLDDASIDDPCRIEYGELARAVSAAIGQPLGSLASALDTGPNIDMDRLRAWAEAYSGTEDVDRVMQDHVDRWKHQWLASVGTEALPAPLRTELEVLDAKLGVLEAPLAPVAQVTSWVGPTSPLSTDEMAALTPVELVAHLESWHPSGNGWGPEPSHEGQGRELVATLTADPRALSGVEELVHRLRPIYLRSVLQGWEGALKADIPLDWVEVATLIRDVLSHDDRSAYPAEGRDWDDDADFRYAKKAAVALLVELVKKRPESTAVPPEHVASFAQSLIEDGDDAQAWTEYTAERDLEGSDPLTMSLNLQWPMRLRGLTHLLSWGAEKPWYRSASQALDSELERADPHGAASAVMGESLGRLVNGADDWVAERAAEIFGAGALLTRNQQIALTTAISVHHYHPTLFELLSAPMETAIRSQSEVVAGWRSQSDPLQAMGEWVIQSIIRGDTAPDGPLSSAFFQLAPPGVRGQAIGHIAWSFMHAQVVDDEIRDRFGELWDQRVAHVRMHPAHHEELSQFYWFVKSAKFDATWWLARLKEALELDDRLGVERYMIGKEIAEAAGADPSGAFEVLRLLLPRRDESGFRSYDLTKNAIPVVLALAIGSGDADLSNRATAYMHELGEAGYLTLEAEIRRALDGDLTLNDVSD